MRRLTIDLDSPSLRAAGETPFVLGQVTDVPGIEIEGVERLFA